MAGVIWGCRRGQSRDLESVGGMSGDHGIMAYLCVISGWPTWGSIGLGCMVLWHWFWKGSGWEPPQNQCYSTIGRRPIDHSVEELLW